MTVLCLKSGNFGKAVFPRSNTPSLSKKLQVAQQFDFVF